MNRFNFNSKYGTIIADKEGNILEIIPTEEYRHEGNPLLKISKINMKDYLERFIKGSETQDINNVAFWSVNGDYIKPKFDYYSSDDIIKFIKEIGMDEEVCRKLFLSSNNKVTLSLIEEKLLKLDDDISKLEELLQKLN